MAEVCRGTSLLKKGMAECEQDTRIELKVPQDIMVVKPEQVCSPVVPREPAPGFTAEAVFKGNLQDIHLFDYEGQWLVLLFTPLSDSLELKQLLAFSEAMRTFKNLGVEVLVSSCDTIKTQLFLEARSVAQGGVGQINMPLIADADCQLAKKYGVHGGTSDALKNPLRAMFIIDPSGIVKSTSIDDEGRDWRPSQWVFDSLRKLQELSGSDPLDEAVTKDSNAEENSKSNSMIEIEEPVEQSVINLDEEHKSVNNTDKKEQKKAENHMIVVVKGPSHQEVHFKVNKATKFKEIMLAYCDEMDLDICRLRFSYEGDRIFKDFTPTEVGMESGDRLECYKVR